MKAIPSFLAACLCAGSLAVPETTYALSWDWVPRVLRTETSYRNRDISSYPSVECVARNPWGDCVIFKVSKQRKVWSYGDGNNYSDCQFDDYRRSTARHTYVPGCDYGEPRSFETN